MIVSAVERRFRQLPGDDAGHASWHRFVLGGWPTAAGPEVNEWTAFGHPAVFTCVRVLAESVAQLPLLTYRRTPQGKQRATDHPLFPLLHDLPNPELTSPELREWIVASLALRGNALLFKEMTRGGRLRALWPLRWDQVTVRRDPRPPMGLLYHWTGGSADPVWFRADQVWHTRLFGMDGVLGLSPITVLREALGAALAVQEYGGRFFSNGASPSGVLKHPMRLTPEAYQRLRDSWTAQQGGLTNAHKPAILEEGMDWTQIGIPPEDAQFLETRKFDRSQVAGIFRVPAHLVNDLEKATFSNVEHLDIGFVKHSLMPYLVKIEKSAQRDLIPERERADLFVEHLVDGLLRGDFATRTQGYATLVQAGIMTPNEAREKENMNALDGLDVPLQPLNMVPVGEASPTGEPPMRTLPIPERRSAVSRRRIAEGFRPVWRETALRILRGEEREVRKALALHLAGRSVLSFTEALRHLYREDGELRAFIEREASPMILGMGMAIFDEAADEIANPTSRDGLDELFGSMVRAYVARHAAVSETALRQTAEETTGDLDEAFDVTFRHWQQERADRIARRETVQQSRALAKQAYARSGVQRLRWVTVGDNCPFCQRLSGRIIRIDQNFVQDEETWEAEGRQPLTLSNPVGHPPLHRGCNCDIVPA